jgi:peptide/nickel transport system permease protein
VSTVAAAARAVRVRRRWIAAHRAVVIVSVAVIAIAALIAIFGSLLAPHDPNASNLDNAYVGPGPGHLLGYDGQGRDLLSRLLVGARTSLLGPVIVVAISVAAGILLALLAAWRGGWVDAGISACLDVLFAFPALLLAIFTAAVFGPSLLAAALALAVAYTPYIARVLRGEALRERARDYVAALEVQGMPAMAICARHLLPNVMPLIVAQATLLFGYAMVDLAAVSFIGLGVQPPQADWGVMVSSGEAGVLQGYPAESLSAGLCLVVVVVAVNLLGERLSARDLERTT